MTSIGNCKEKVNINHIQNTKVKHFEEDYNSMGRGPNNRDMCFQWISEINHIANSIHSKKWLKKQKDTVCQAHPLKIFNSNFPLKRTLTVLKEETKLHLSPLPYFVRKWSSGLEILLIHKLKSEPQNFYHNHRKSI